MNVVDACPRCGVVALHYLRAPDPRRTGAARTIVRPDGETTELRLWGGELDERNFEAIRVCRQCSHTWGINELPKGTNR